ncbi:MAG: VanZ family protein [Eubacteriales bacterium]|nr:VanZ family protein [Eubacteriales bacterium]
MLDSEILENKKTIYFILFIVYILIVLKLTVFRFAVYYDEPQINLALFSELIKVYRNIGLREFSRLFLGNIGWFIPFGFLLPMLLKKKSLLKVLAFGLMFSFIIEILQFISHKGVAELDDLILNIIGVIIGYYLYKSQSYFLRLKYNSTHNPEG